MDGVEGDTSAAASDNGFVTNGFTINGFATNGFTANGFTTNGFAMNGFTTNGFATNGFATNGFANNGFTINGFTNNGFTNNGATGGGWAIDGIAKANGLSYTSGLMTTAGGREFVRYLVKVAFPAGHSFTAQDNMVPANTYTFDGSLGVAPEMETGTCDVDCQERVSAAMLAHVNNSGLHVGIWLVGPDSGIGWATSTDYPYQEGGFFGNVFTPNPQGSYCGGKNLSAGVAKGRMGDPLAANNAILNSPYGMQWDAVSGSNVPVFCSTTGNAYCAASGGGFSSCTDHRDPNAPPPYTSAHTNWNHVVTVWRNFEPTQIYKICNKAYPARCLGVVGGSTSSGANIEQKTYGSALGQAWQILQVNPGQYKIVNRTSGMVLTLNGSQFQQAAYTGGSNQLLPISYIASEPGRANLKTVSMGNGPMMMGQNGNAADALVQSVANYPNDSGSPDAARWSFQPLGLATFDPGRFNRLIPQNATGSSLDVCNASTTNGTCVQIWSSWNGDPQKFIVAPAANGNVVIQMKLNTAKCIGPANNGTTAGTQLVVQDCNGSFNQSWMTSEQGTGSGKFAYRNAAAPTLCMDVAGGTSSNGAKMQLFNCTGASNQIFQVLAQ